MTFPRFDGHLECGGQAAVSGEGVWARLAALLPDKPSQSVIALLHRYGVDCIFRTAPGEYDRLDAPTEARSHLRQRWYA